MRYFSFIVLLSWLISSECAWGTSTTRDSATYVGEYHGVHEYRLNNQLQILLKPDTASTDLVVNMIYHNGKKNEHLGLREISHVLEHYLVIQSEEKVRLESSVLKYKAMGVTASDYTYYYSKLKAVSELSSVIKLEKQRMSQFTDHLPHLQQAIGEVDKELVAKYQNKFVEESGLMLKDIFRNEAYAVNPASERADLQRITLQDIKQYWAEHYRPDRATLVIAGNFDLPGTLALITEQFSSLSVSQPDSKKFEYQKLPQYGEREFISRAHNAKPVVWVAYKVPPLNSPEFAVARMTSALIFPDTDTGIWQKTLLDAKKAESVGSYIFPFVHGSAFMLRIRLSTEKQLAELRKFLAQEEKNFALRVTDKMINAQKAELLDDLNKNEKSPKLFVERIASHVASGDWQSYYRLREQVEQLDAATYRQSVQQWFRPENRTLGIFIDPRDSQTSQVPETGRASKPRK
ncbi:M16 family metallopeptidase [Undibacterium curvum]|uniref:Insulinase family protein n=1 Tax=Undibacterium curvum TaxID=2762294 RepID=A0ABR7A9I7_9BURK|nr:insulinase family protein [Undibacterium curvum]MBC3933573.1 insulinase family protein [Undibacterium curvum]